MRGREFAPKPIELATKFGILIEGWGLEDYLLAAAKDPKGYETVAVWGVQGSGKSSRMLQMGFWIFRDLLGDDDKAWRAVLDHLLFRPSTLVERLEAVPPDQVLPVLLWDDVNVHFPASKFRTDIAQYEAIDSTWAAIRTKVHVILTTIPLVDRLAKNIKDNTTFEVFLGKNQMQVINRVFHLPGIRSMESNFFKVVVEEPATFSLFTVPDSIWREYWAMRIKLTQEALSTLRGATDMGDLKGYIPVLEAAKIAKTQKIRYNTGTIQQDISRGILRGQRVNGKLCVNEEDFHANMALKGRDI